ncbi:hypothetical protein D3C84_875920 [compost metagenome]
MQADDFIQAFDVDRFDLMLQRRTQIGIQFAGAGEDERLARRARLEAIDLAPGGNLEPVYQGRQGGEDLRLAVGLDRVVKLHPFRQCRHHLRHMLRQRIQVIDEQGQGIFQPCTGLIDGGHHRCGQLIHAGPPCPTGTPG